MAKVFKALQFIKYNGEYLQAGDLVEVAEKDIKVLVETGLIAPEVEVPSSPPPFDPKQSEYFELTVDELKEILVEEGIEFPAKANKEDLVILLLEGEENA